MRKQTATVKVYRYDPKADQGPSYNTYQVPLTDDLSVLTTLQYIQEHFDGGLSFRYGCEGPQHCKCGACAVVVNGQPALSCQRRAEASMVIEPHWKYTVIKDLTVDFRNIVRHRDPALVARQKVAITVDEDACDGCGDCVAVCPTKVWKLYKRKAVPDDIDSCCGPDCGQCSQYCPQKAITVALA
ncbi:MAG: 4Fe-4S binding protein [Chloroflexi bacterium]|nr:4Fe-4S binding protein [Chloroflexota bacterium]